MNNKFITVHLHCYGFQRGEKGKEDKRTEDSKNETRRAACNLLHPKLSGDAPPRRVVAANPPSRGVCVRGAEWAWGGKQQISKGAQGLSLLEPFANMCLAFLGQTVFARLDLLSVGVSALCDHIYFLNINCNCNFLSY